MGKVFLLIYFILFIINVNCRLIKYMYLIEKSHYIFAKIEHLVIRRLNFVQISDTLWLINFKY